MANKKNIKFRHWMLLYIPMVIVANVLLYFLSKTPNNILNAGVLDYLYINLSIISGIFIGRFLIKWLMRRKKNVPIADERTLLFLKNYLLIAMFIGFILSSIILMTMFFMGIETIEIGWIFVYLSGLIILTIAGGIVLSRV